MRKQYIDLKEKISRLKVSTQSTHALDFSKLLVMAGPCAVESEPQMRLAAAQVKASGAQILRAGAFKPRTSPYSFQGLGLEGLRLLIKMKHEFQMPIVTEIMDPHLIDRFIEDVDILQIGSRNMQNFSLLKEVGQTQKPVLLKRGFSATLEEFILAAEYLASHGNQQVMLCERGIRTFETVTRNTLDLSAVAILKQLTSLPVIVDPSHGTGIKDILPAVSKAALACGAQGLMIEVHPNPEQAQSDKEHALAPEEFEELMHDLRGFHEVMGHYHA